MTHPVLDAFDRQAVWCAQPSPFSARVLARTRFWLAGASTSGTVGHDAEAAGASQAATALQALAALTDDPLAGAVPLRWLSGLHHLALLGQQPWAELWPPAPGPVTDAALDAAIHAAWHTRQPHMRAALAGPPQTNEVQRSAALLPGLLHVAARTRRPLALAEIGSSAGLNLWCDHFRHEHGPAGQPGPADQHWAWGDPAAGLTLRCDWRGAAPPHQLNDAPLHIASRAGCDAQPVDLALPGEDLRLCSFIWPDQAERLARLRAALGVARVQQARTQLRVQPLRAAAFVRQQLASRPAGHTWVLMHSVVWQYIDAAEQADITQQVQQAGAAATAGAPLAWLRFEPPRPDQGVELRCRIWPGSADELLAVCHPHATWVHWQAAA
jgi:hypothetical protein